MNVTSYVQYAQFNGVSNLETFDPVTTDEIKQIIMTSPNTSCEVDPLPTWMLKNCLEEILPLITTLVNKSLSTGCFPHSFKEAIIRPILKKPNMDMENLKNYRPVSNLHFMSKIIEKVVLRRLKIHLLENDLHNATQSAYKANHSTETALLKINNDILSGLDTSKCILLVSLDLSAAFDTVCHKTLLRRLEQTFGVKGLALKWFVSYLTNRKQRVVINNNTSEAHSLQCGVPQGSVLGAILYTLYTQPLSDIITNHSVLHHSYADDTQLYLQCDHTESALASATVTLEDCLIHVNKWMACNSLQLNKDKTEFIVFSRKKDIVERNISIEDQTVKSQNKVKILGVTLDCNMTLVYQITNVCRAVHINIRKIKRIRTYLTESALRTLVQHTVITRLDYCNSLYNGLCMKSLKRLQLAQNAAARMIKGINIRESISPVLKDLHWLPVTKRCQYKLLVLTYKALHGTAPIYICEMITWYHPTRPLRSANVPSLVPNRNKTVKIGRRLCDTASAVLWNNLPTDMKCAESLMIFKKRLKTFLF